MGTRLSMPTSTGLTHFTGCENLVIVIGDNVDGAAIPMPAEFGTSLAFEHQRDHCPGDFPYPSIWREGKTDARWQTKDVWEGAQ